MFELVVYFGLNIDIFFLGGRDNVGNILYNFYLTAKVVCMPENCSVVCAV